MPQGTVKFWKNERGFGFIQPDDGSEDTFVHCSQLNTGRDHLTTGERVEYEVGPNPRNDRQHAINVRSLERQEASRVAFGGVRS